MFHQMNRTVGSLRRSWYNSKASVIFLNKTLESQLLVNCKYDLEEVVARQGAEVCIYLLMLLL